jgi:hypothetical protein
MFSSHPKQGGTIFGLLSERQSTRRSFTCVKFAVTAALCSLPCFALNASLLETDQELHTREFLLLK